MRSNRKKSKKCSQDRGNTASGKYLLVRLEVCTTTLPCVALAVNDDVGIEGRGVVVYIYSGTELGGTPSSLKAYEKGEYGNYFD